MRNCRVSRDLGSVQMPDRELTLAYVHPNGLRHAWPFVRHGLEKMPSGGHWIPEDLYMEIKSGQSHLHLGLIDGEVKGFIITKKIQDSDGPVLHIWSLYSEARDFSVFIEGLDGEIHGWARAINASRISFTSPRKGWERVAHKLGFEPVQVVYERQVQPE